MTGTVGEGVPQRTYHVSPAWEGGPAYSIIGWWLYFSENMTKRVMLGALAMHIAILTWCIQCAVQPHHTLHCPALLPHDLAIERVVNSCLIMAAMFLHATDIQAGEMGTSNITKSNAPKVLSSNITSLITMYVAITCARSASSMDWQLLCEVVSASWVRLMRVVGKALTAIE